MNDRPSPVGGLTLQHKKSLLDRLLRARAGRIKETYPLSYNQKGLYVIHQANPESAAYHVAFTARIDSPVNPAALRHALQALVDRNAALRTTFAMENGEPVQVVHGAAEAHLECFQSAGWSDDELDRQVREHYRRPFDLENGPIMRTALFQSQNGAGVLLIAIHHIVFDGWSLWMLLNELGPLYAAAASDSRLPSASAQHPYSEFVQWQSAMLAAPEGERHWNYWREQLSGSLPMLDLPTDRPYPVVRRSRGASHWFELPQELSSRIRELAHNEGTTSFITLLASYQILLSRYSGQDDIIVGVPTAGSARGREAFSRTMGCFVNPVVIRSRVAGGTRFKEFLADVRNTVLSALEHQDYPFALLVERLNLPRDASRTLLFQSAMIYQKPQLGDRLVNLLVPSNERFTADMGGLRIEPFPMAQQEGQFELTFEVIERESLYCIFKYDADLFLPETVARMEVHIRNLLESIVAAPETPVGKLAMLAADEFHGLVEGLNQTAAIYPKDRCIHQLFEEQAARTPSAAALAFEDRQVSYAELNDRANVLADRLRGAGVGPESLVGIHVARSIEMVVGLLAILKAGGAWVPLDPGYPAERLALILEDSNPAVILTQENLLNHLPAHSARVLCLDDSRQYDRADGAPPGNAANQVGPENLAYVIYTSGSTGRPKGVMVEHRQVVNFMAGMDARIGGHAGDTFLAVTTISFDISVLEIFWSLTRGLRVVIQGESTGYFDAPQTRPAPAKPIQFSLFYFANDSDGAPDQDRYRLLLEGARFADDHEFTAVWTPERHFHAFGGLYPNPSVIGAALAVATRRVQIRAGSVVLPLQSPIRVAEEWSVVDNLSRGRVGISFASGWRSTDFVLAPGNWAGRKSRLSDNIRTVQRLWRGESVEFEGPDGKPVAVQTLPRPVQPSLPIWVTSAGNLETIRLAAEIGAGLLTHLLGQDLDQLARSIRAYREVWRENGHPGEGHVTLMLHSFIGEDRDAVRNTVRGPFCDYLRSSADLMKDMAKGAGMDLSSGGLTESDMDALLARAFDRYFETSGLFGTPESCLAMVDQLRSAGVDEIACLIDFGIPVDTVLGGLESLDQLRRNCNRAESAAGADFSLPAQLIRYQVTHMQCTPSLARLMMDDPRTRQALRQLRVLLVGGEALPFQLGCRLREELDGAALHNMYGPTETTIWSTTWDFAGLTDKIYVGRPIANTQTYVLDEFRQPVPAGVKGELYIGGDGVARGYRNLPDLTASRFIADPFRKEAGARLYRTGDVARISATGSIEILGRTDDQTKIRGFRIELGEIEAALNSHPGVREAVVVTHEDASGERRLVAFVTPSGTQVNGKTAPDSPTLTMSPGGPQLLSEFPNLTLPNGLTVFHHDPHQTLGIAREVFESQDYHQDGIRYADGDCIVDVGANIGLFSLYVHQQCRNPVLYGFEPIPDNFEIARRNFDLYGLKVNLYNCGISDRTGVAKFTFYPKMSGLSGCFANLDDEIAEAKAMFLHYLENGPGGKRVLPEDEELDRLFQDRYHSVQHQCSMRTLSDFFHEAGLQRIDMLKIDVEKSEAAVMRGIQAEDWSKIRQLAVEVHTQDLLREVERILDDHGFEHVTKTMVDIPASGIHPRVDLYLVSAFNPAFPKRAQQAAPISASAAALRSFLQAKLPPYMVPAEFVPIDAIPRTLNGKVERKALRENFLSREAPVRHASNGFTPPRNQIEQRMAALWADLLGARDIGIHDDFFQLGGHSLLSVQLMFRIRDSFGANIPLQTLMQKTTVAALSLEIMKLQLGSDRKTILNSLEGLTDAEAEDILTQMEVSADHR